MLERVLEAPSSPDRRNRAIGTQTDILALFVEALKREGNQPDDDFFDLGGDSLKAVHVMAAIEAQFDVSLPVSAILEAPTARLLACLVDEARDKGFDSCVIRVQEAGTAAAVVVVHGISGDVRYARDVARILGPTRPVYGLRALGLRAGESPILTIPDIAARYVSDLKRVCPVGPYFVHGYCGGAFIAFEVAQQLRHAGHDVDGPGGGTGFPPPFFYRESSATDLGALAQRAGVGHLMLTHLIPPVGAPQQGPFKLPDGALSKDDYVAAVRDGGFEGDTIVGEDMVTLQLPGS